MGPAARGLGRAIEGLSSRTRTSGAGAVIIGPLPHRKIGGGPPRADALGHLGGVAPPARWSVGSGFTEVAGGRSDLPGTPRAADRYAARHLDSADIGAPGRRSRGALAAGAGDGVDAEGAALAV